MNDQSPESKALNALKQISEMSTIKKPGMDELCGWLEPKQEMNVFRIKKQFKIPERTTKDFTLHLPPQPQQQPQASRSNRSLILKENRIELPVSKSTLRLPLVAPPTHNRMHKTPIHRKRKVDNQLLHNLILGLPEETFMKRVRKIL